MLYIGITINKEDVEKVPESTEKGVPYCVGYSGELEEVIKAYMEGMIFALGPEWGENHRRKTSEWRNRAVRENRLFQAPEMVWRF